MTRDLLIVRGSVTRIAILAKVRDVADDDKIKKKMKYFHSQQRDLRRCEMFRYDLNDRSGDEVYYI